MISVIFATNNKNKAEEINAILGNRFTVKTLKEEGIDIDIEEPYDSISENATEKARVIYDLTGKPCFGEDTGLEIDALNGRPGVKSARYAGAGRSSEDNISKVLSEMNGLPDRAARFRTVICLKFDQNHILFEGICEGTILASPLGNNGFGYDPVFKPAGADKSFAEMDMQEKNKYSHRRKAVDKLIDFLNAGTIS